MPVRGVGGESRTPSQAAATATRTRLVQNLYTSLTTNPFRSHIPLTTLWKGALWNQRNRTVPHHAEIPRSP